MSTVLYPKSANLFTRGKLAILITIKNSPRLRIPPSARHFYRQYLGEPDLSPNLERDRIARFDMSYRLSAAIAVKTATKLC